MIRNLISCVFVFLLLLSHPSFAQSKKEVDDLRTNFNALVKELKSLNLSAKDSVPPAKAKLDATVKLAKDVQKKLTAYTNKEIDLVFFEAPLSQWQVAVSRAQKAKAPKAQALSQKNLVKWSDYLINHPLLEIWEMNSQIYWGGKKLLSQEFAKAEDLFNDADHNLDAINKRIKKELKPDFENVEEELNTYLLSSRREEEVAKSKVSAIWEKIAKDLDAVSKKSLVMK